MERCKKIKTKRVSVTLPMVMAENFKAKAELAGVSVSQLIVKQLKNKKKIAIVSDRLMAEVSSLREAVEKLAATGIFSADVVACLRQQVLFYEGWLS